MQRISKMGGGYILAAGEVGYSAGEFEDAVESAGGVAVITARAGV